MLPYLCRPIAPRTYIGGPRAVIKNKQRAAIKGLAKGDGEMLDLHGGCELMLQVEEFVPNAVEHLVLPLGVLLLSEGLRAVVHIEICIGMCVDMCIGMYVCV